MSPKGRVVQCGVLLMGAVFAACAGRAGAPTAGHLDPLTAGLGEADTLRVETVAPGVRHAYAWVPEGPWAVHVVEVDPRACAGFDARHSGPPLTRTAPTSALASGAVAAVNADFFALPEGTPVNAQVDDRHVLIAPGRWQVVAWDDTGPLIGEPTLRASVGPLAVARINRVAPEGDAGPGLYTHWFGAVAAVDSAAVGLRLQRLSGTADSGTARVVRRAEAPAELPLDSTTMVVTGPAAALAQLGAGDTVAWRVRVEVQGRAVTEAVGGFPVLLRDGVPPAELETEPRPSFGLARHPRTAMGWRGDGAVLLVTVDGRQPPYSDGMTLPELARLLAGLGAEEALNLDGGGSTTMVVGGVVVNRTSDADGERPVGNALRVVERPCPR